MSQSDVARHEGCRRQHKARISQGNVAKHEGAEDNTACVSQSDVVRHEGSEGNTKFACHKAMWLGTTGAEGNTKLACRKAMWLGMRGAEGNTKLASDGGGVPKETCAPNDDEVPKGTEEWENDRSLLCQFPQTAPNC
ncbi:unnamed protein product [Prunus armeniaca]